jgi:NADPH:quinone reductase-like Zn-dependent oxidoreductase
MVRSLGASRVFDYKNEDFLASGQQYDVVLDNVGNRPLGAYRGILKPRGIFVGNGGGGPDDMIWGFGFFSALIRSLVMSWLGSRKFVGVFANVNERDLTELAHLVECGKISPAVDRRYPLAETAEAIRHVETMRARGKVIIVV